ncbi:MAG: transcription factor S [Candidatus Aenigmatarchaeota archaeon]|nr:transcription factor S [Candidatus Aenigmarchaeota archaeon]
MEFCKKCNSLMLPEKKGKEAYLKCTKCGHKEKIDASKSSELRIIKKHEIKKTITIEKEDVNLPITDKMCPSCGYTQAFYFLQQTRAADEPPTQFFKCKKCGHIWREY